MADAPGTEPGPDRANTFFALVPPAPVRAAVAALQAELTPKLPPAARPVAADNFHITLAFLGAVERARLPDLIELARSLAMAPSAIHLDCFGVFPRARVGWLGCSAVDPSLIDFQGQLVSMLEAAGFAPDARPWVPHLTLYRKLRKAPDKVSVDIGGWDVESFALLRTRSTKTGPVYARMDAWKARR